MIPRIRRVPTGLALDSDAHAAGRTLDHAAGVLAITGIEIGPLEADDFVELSHAHLADLVLVGPRLMPNRPSDVPTGGAGVA